MTLTALLDLQREIEVWRRKLDVLRQVACVTTSKISGVPKAKNHSSTTESITLKIIETENRIAELCKDFAALSLELTAEINRRVAGVENTILFLRYIQCMPFADIATLMNLSESRVYQLHRNGKRTFEHFV